VIVCICEGKTDRDIRHAVEDGCQSLKDVGDALRAGTDCGSCCKQILELLEGHRQAVQDRRSGRQEPTR